MLVHALLCALSAPALSAPTLAAPSQAAARADEISPPGLVLIRGGRTTIGTERDDAEDLIRKTDFRTIAGETPQHEVKLDDFYLMVTEVTNEQYAHYVRETGAKPPQKWGNEAIDAALQAFLKSEQERMEKDKLEGKPIERRTFDKGRWWDANWRDAQWEVPSDGANLPVEFIDYEGAVGYAYWAGLRLMTEFEYQRAVRGDTDRRYPWGDEFVPKKYAATIECVRDLPWVVGSFREGASKEGVFDLAGNLWEWTSSPYVEYPGYKPLRVKFGEKRDAREETVIASWNSTERVVVGGSYKNDGAAARAATRRATERFQATDALGFRCAATPAPGVDLAHAIVDRHVSESVLPPEVLFAPERVVCTDRWQSSPGSAPVPGYAVITAYDYFAFIPVSDVQHAQVKDLREHTVENGPMILGVLATSQPMLEPALPAGTYLVGWRAAGEPKAKDEVADEAALPDPAPIWDVSKDQLVFFDATAQPLLALGARDLEAKRLENAGTVYGRPVMPTERERDAGIRPYDVLTFDVPLPVGKSQRGYVLDLRIKLPADAYTGETWRRPR